jgi:four helix bundle protein
MRRAAVSIPSNIAEGAARRSNKEFLQFLSIAAGSASELDTQIVISKKLHFIPTIELEKLGVEVKTVSKMLQGLMRAVRGSDQLPVTIL